MNKDGSNKDKEYKLGKLAAQLPGVIYQYRLKSDGTSHFPYASEGIELIYGLTPKQVTEDASNVFDRLYPDDLERVEQSIKESAQSLSEWNEVYRVTLPAGRIIWVEGNATPQKLEDDSILWHGYIRDITERKKAQDALRERELRYIQLAEQSGTFNWEIDIDGLYTYIDPIAESIIGYKPDEIVDKKHFFDLIPENDREEIKHIGFRAVREGESVSGVENRVLTKKGEIVWVETTAVPLRDKHGKITGVRGSDKDITKRKHLENALKESRRKLKRLSDNLKDGFVYQINVGIDGTDRNFMYLSEGAEQLMDYSIDDVLKDASIIYSKIPDEDRKLIKRKQKKSLKNQSTMRVEFRMTISPGDTRWFAVSSSPRQNSDGEWIFDGIALDITNLKKAENDLKKLSTAVEQSPASVVITDTDGNIEYVNPKFVDITGYSREDAIGQNPSILKSGFQSQEYYRELWKTITSGNVWRGELHNKKKNGELYWEDASIAPVLDKDGNITNYLAIKEDITARKDVEKEVKRFKTISDNAMYGVAIADMDGNLTYINNFFANIHGYEPDELIGKRYTVLHVKNRLGELNKLLERLIKTGSFEPNVVWHVNRDGKEFPMLMSGVLIKGERGEPQYMAVSVIDVTDYYKAREKLKQSEQRYRSIISVSNTGAWEYDTKNGTLWCSPEYFTMLGYEPIGEEKKGSYNRLERWINLIHPEDKKDAEKKFADYLAGDMRETYENYFRMVHKEGHDVWVWSRGENLKNEDGSASDLILGTHIDITKIKKAEEKVQESELYHRSLIQTIPDIILVMSKDGKLVDYNVSDEEDLLLSPSLFINKNIREFMPEDVAIKFNKAIKNCFTVKRVAEFEYALKINDEIRHYSANVVAFGDKKVIISIRNITDYRENLDKINALLVAEEKQMESLRNFTYIVSHNLRIHTANMLGVLMLLEMEDPELYESQYVQMIKETSENLEETIDHLNQVLEIRLDENQQKEKVNIYSEVETAIGELFTRAEKAGIEIINDVSKRNEVYTVPAYLQNIIMSLLTNAVKYRDKKKNSYVRFSAEKHDGSNLLVVEDNGVGVDLERHGDKMFNMYKKFHDENHSKGLGLFIAKNQVEAMGGHIEVESVLHKGSTFTIYLPDEKN